MTGSEMYSEFKRKKYPSNGHFCAKADSVLHYVNIIQRLWNLKVDIGHQQHQSCLVNISLLLLGRRHAMAQHKKWSVIPLKCIKTEVTSLFWKCKWSWKYRCLWMVMWCVSIHLSGRSSFIYLFVFKRMQKIPVHVPTWSIFFNC